MAVDSSRRIEDALDDILAALSMSAPGSPQPLTDARRIEDALDDILAAVAAQSDGNRRLELLLAQLLEVMVADATTPALPPEVVAALHALSERSDVPEVEFDFERFAKVIKESMPRNVSTSSGLGSIAIQKVLELLATEATLQEVLAALENLEVAALPEGTYTYESGIGTGTITTTGPMLSVNVIAGVFADSTFQIGSGPVVTVPRRSNLTLNQEAKIGSTTVTFTAVASIVVDWLGPSNGLLFDGSSLLFDGSLLTFTPGG